MSSSSSHFSSSLPYQAGSTMTWQVEHAMAPSHAPSMSMPWRKAISSTESPMGASTSWRVPSGSTKVMVGTAGALPILRRRRRRPSSGW